MTDIDSLRMCITIIISAGLANMNINLNINFCQRTLSALRRI